MLGHDCIQLYTFSIAGSLRNILKFHDISLRYFYITGHWTMIFFPLYDLIKSKWDIHFLQTAFFSKYCYCFRLMNFYWFQIHTRKRILFEKTTFQRLFHRTSIPNFYPHVFIPKDCFQILSSDARYLCTFEYPRWANLCSPTFDCTANLQLLKRKRSVIPAIFFFR